MLHYPLRRDFVRDSLNEIGGNKDEVLGGESCH